MTAALGVIRSSPGLRTQLWANVKQLYDGLVRAGFELGTQKGPIIAVHLPDAETGVKVWHELLEAGVYVNLALPPATPNDVPLLRCSVCAAHSREELSRMIEQMAEIGQRHGLLAIPAKTALG